jgi:hypothetical protein
MPQQRRRSTMAVAAEPRKTMSFSKQFCLVAVLLLISSISNAVQAQTAEPSHRPSEQPSLSSHPSRDPSSRWVAMMLIITPIAQCSCIYILTTLLWIIITIHFRPSRDPSSRPSNAPSRDPSSKWVSMLSVFQPFNGADGPSYNFCNLHFSGQVATHLPFHRLTRRPGESNIFVTHILSITTMPEMMMALQISLNWIAGQVVTRPVGHHPFHPLTRQKGECNIHFIPNIHNVVVDI